MMQQVQQMQQQMQQAQEELAKETVTASAGGGAVKATMTGGLELVSVEIDPDVVDPEDVEMLQDMVQAAVNEALADRKSTRLNSSHANISYAVFCLKKKKTNHRAMHRL